jgi:prepilin-type N-terminal cleavage/methylation domain-containing protein
MIGNKSVTGELSQNGRFRRIVRRGGFTIIELLIVILLFSLASLAISATYINLTRSHRRAANAEALGEELRYMTELMIRATRNDRVSYATNPVSYQRTSIDLLNSANKQISFAWSAAANTVCSGLNVQTGCLTMYVQDTTASYIPLSGKNIDILDFKVYTTPTYDPFTPIALGTYQNQKQPIITYYIKAKYHASDAREEATVTLQTSVESRVYVR